MSRPRSPETQPAAAAAEDPRDVIEVDHEDADSAYPESLNVSDTQSLRSSILNYKWENGRRYHAYRDGAYWGPNDEQQQEAEDILHEMYRIILGDKIYKAPLKKDTQRILDVGCGTGTWAIEMADEFPSAEVIGIDLSPIQPPFVPPNCRFEIDDINEPWTFADDSFDFVHVRLMTGCISGLVDFHKKALKSLKPGGWVEHVEPSAIGQSDDGTVTPTSPHHTWVSVFRKMSALTGKTFFSCEEAGGAVREAGFVNVTEQRIKVPIGTWPRDKELKHWGAWNRQFLLRGLEGFSIRSLRDLGWSNEETQVFLAAMRNEISDNNVHSWMEMCVVNGQKPEA